MTRFRNFSKYRWVLVELAAITLIGFLYLSLAIPLRDNKSAFGVEYERLTGVLLVVEVGLKQYDQIPTWNPHMGIGEPLLGNAFNYLFDPFASVPVLLLGGIQGSKLAIGIGFLLAGYNMWALCRVMGIGVVGRITAGALYMMSGGIAGKFNPGHFQLGLSLAWPPLVFAGLWWTLHSRDHRAPVLMAAAFALLFFTGNIYYTLHTLVCCVVMVAFCTVQRKTCWRLQIDRLKRVAVGGVFAIGLASLQFMPVWAVRDSVIHSGDPLLSLRYGLDLAAANFVIPFDDWFFRVPEKMLVSVDYAFIGPIAFMLIGAAALLLLTRRRAWQFWRSRDAAMAVLLALAMMVWGMGQSGILEYLYMNVPLLSQFRFVGRAHSIASLWWIVLIAMCVNVLWRGVTLSHLPTEADRKRTFASAFDHYDLVRLARAAALGAGSWLILTYFDMQGVVNRLPQALDLAERLDTYRFGYNTYPEQVLPQVWVFVLGAIVLDTVLLAGERLSPLGQRAAREYGVGLRAIGTRILRIGVLVVVMAAIANIMLVNMTVFSYGLRVIDLSNVYRFTHFYDTTAPYPAINEPRFEEHTFESYYLGTRQWGLDEGWIPAALPSVIESGNITDQATWVTALEMSQPEAQGYEYAFQQCVETRWKLNPDAECDDYARMPVVLFHLPNALPYAFAAPRDTLLVQPETLKGSNVGMARLVTHEQDTITIVMETPDDGQWYSLVVQETHFPGWLGFVDGVPAKTASYGRYIGMAMQPGIHTYTLRYQPPGFATGFVLFLGTLLAMGFYLRREKRQYKRNY